MEKEENWTGKRICKGGVNNEFFLVQEPLREEVHHFLKRVRSNLSLGPLLRDGFLKFYIGLSRSLQAHEVMIMPYACVTQIHSNLSLNFQT